MDRIFYYSKRHATIMGHSVAKTIDNKEIVYTANLPLINDGKSQYLWPDKIEVARIHVSQLILSD